MLRRVRGDARLFGESEPQGAAVATSTRDGFINVVGNQATCRVNWGIDKGRLGPGILELEHLSQCKTVGECGNSRFLFSFKDRNVSKPSLDVLTAWRPV
jgi:hypothetical protein